MRALSISVAVPLLVLVLGCSSSHDDASAAQAGAPAPAPVLPASGTRLHAKLVTGGGAREVVGFHDMKRDEDCTFQYVGAGRARCLPQTTTRLRVAAFADSACKVPLVSLPASCGDTPKYAMILSSDSTCTGRPQELQTLVPSTGPRYLPGPAGCTLQLASPSLTPAFTQGDTVPLVEFVDAKVSTVPTLGNPVSETVLVGADGSRQHVGFHSEPQGVDCTFEVLTDGVIRCVPEGRRGSLLYGDAACSVPLALRSDLPACPDPSVKYLLDVADVGACRNVRAAHTFRFDGGPEPALYTRRGSSPDQCAPIAPIPPGAVGTGLQLLDVDVTAFLPTMPRVGTGDGRLAPALVAARASLALVPGWHDTERDVDCRFTRASDGKTRCLPTTTLATLFSTDGHCTSAAHVAVFTETACTFSSGFALVPSSTCPSTTRVFAINGPEHDVANASSETSPGRCAAFPSVGKAYDATEVDPTQFVEGTVLAE